MTESSTDIDIKIDFTVLELDIIGLLQRAGFVSSRAECSREIQMVPLMGGRFESIPDM